ncbi:MAG: hypothetical protein GXO40_06980, partial [Epsilonproteobacteria bacterium]|nr:hypothetical protein [Campylobacterota bacterium]
MQTIFYTKDFDEEITHPVNVILSPQFYWIKKIDAPVKNIFQAKKIAQNMFDLEEEYIYEAINVDNTFFAIAIKKDLSLKIDAKYINAIYIAQSELHAYDCLNVSKNHSIKKIDGILFCFPSDEKCQNIEDILPNIKLSKYAIRLKDDRFVLPIVALLLINIAFVITNISIHLQANRLEEKLVHLTTTNHLPSTSFELDSILSSLKKFDNAEVRLRKNLEFITNVPKTFISLSFDGKYYVEIDTQDNMDKYFTKRFKIVSRELKPHYKVIL